MVPHVLLRSAYCCVFLQDEDIGSIPQTQKALEATVKEAETKLAVVKRLLPLWLRYTL